MHHNKKKTYSSEDGIVGDLRLLALQNRVRPKGQAKGAQEGDRQPMTMENLATKE
jgi:hypothetical protein